MSVYGTSVAPIRITLPIWVSLGGGSIAKPRCAGSKPDGTPCERIVGASQTYCFSHDPARKEIRAEWYAYHLDQAERLRRTMEPLIALHEARAAKLLEALEGDVVSVGEAGFTQREDVLQLLTSSATDKTTKKGTTA